MVQSCFASFWEELNSPTDTVETPGGWVNSTRADWNHWMIYTLCIVSEV